MTSLAPDNQPTTASKTPSRRRLGIGWLILGLIIGALVVLFLVFRPAANDEMVADDGEPKVWAPVIYDTANWAGAPMQSQDWEQLKAMLGATATTDEALDFYGNSATRLRFSASHEPPLYVIESPRLFEIVWYYPSARDDDATKDKGVDYAQRGYRLMSMMGGEQGEATVAQLLTGAKLADVRFGDYLLIESACRDYQCRMVFSR